MANINDVSDYIIFRCKAEGESELSALKHQKLLYYVQAWHLAFYGKEAFDSEFQAWIHGPVNREIYDLYKDKKYLYSEMRMEDIQDHSFLSKIPIKLRLHIDSILDAYAKYTATELESMTHREKPWIEAREGYYPSERCEVPIKNESMKKYYALRLKKDKPE